MYAYIKITHFVTLLHYKKYCNNTIIVNAESSRKISSCEYIICD